MLISSLYPGFFPILSPKFLAAYLSATMWEVILPFLDNLTTKKKKSLKWANQATLQRSQCVNKLVCALFFVVYTQPKLRIWSMLI